jgi:hypothetical protein
MARGRKARASNEGPRAEGRGPRASDAAPEAAVLGELLERAARALDELDSLFDESKRYFDEVINNITREIKLTKEDVIELKKFKESILESLDRARGQARERLTRLVTALEEFLNGDNGAVAIERRAKGLRIRPSTAEWFVSAWAPPRSSWRFTLHIHDVSAHTRFPDVVKWSLTGLENLESAQSGWRASDEGCDWWRRPVIVTTRAWQVLAWAATRYGRLHVMITAVHLNKQGHSIEWRLKANDWYERWHGPSGKQLARELARTKPLGLLTLYLGDGCKHPNNLIVAVGRDIELYKKGIVPMIIKKAYEVGYGQFLDAVKCDKWQVLKNLAPKRNPTHASLNGHTFYLYYSHSEGAFRARAHTKSEEEALSLKQLLATLGAHACIYTTRKRNVYWVVDLYGPHVLRLAELFPEWRNALRELIEKIEPRDAAAKRKLLELAESPPLP